MILCALWFFAVSVFYHATPTDVARYAGGWTHDGPYQTRAECEKARLVVEAQKFSSTRYHRAMPCKSLTFEEYARQVGSTPTGK